MLRKNASKKAFAEHCVARAMHQIRRFSELCDAYDAAAYADRRDIGHQRQQVHERARELAEIALHACRLVGAEIPEDIEQWGA